MQYSDYLNRIFAKADEICTKTGIGYRAIESIYIAMLFEYRAEYETNEPPFKIGNSIAYERERMSYIIEQCNSGPRAELLERRLKRDIENLLDPSIMADVVNESENIAEKRDQKVISADIMLTAILPRIRHPFSLGLRSPLADFLSEANREAAEKAPAFMADRISKRIARIEEETRKAEEPASFINRKPIEKIGEEDAVRKQIIDSIKVEHFDKYSTLTLPYFFPDSNEALCLKLSAKDNRVYISDLGRSYAELQKRCDENTAIKSSKYFARVDLEIELNQQCEIVSPIRNPRGFFVYLQALSRIANADMYPSIDKYYYSDHKKYSEKYDFPDEGMPAADFIADLLREFKVTYNNDLGICFRSPYYFHGEPCPMWICFKKDGGTISATDYGDYDGGRLFERMCRLNDDIHLYDSRISAICDRFHCTYKDEKIYYLFKNSDGLSLPKAIFTFMQTASVLGEIGHFVVL